MSDINRKRLTCYEERGQDGRSCTVTSCKFWSQSGENQNCGVIASAGKMMTLQQVANFLGVSRMRVCQIEATAQNKIVEQFKKNSELNEIDVMSLFNDR